MSAIECHTTLKKDANDYDKAVFLSDKIAWDQEGEPPYKNIVLKALNQSLDQACYQFIKYQFDYGRLLMPHQWLLDAYGMLSKNHE